MKDADTTIGAIEAKRSKPNENATMTTTTQSHGSPIKGSCAHWVLRKKRFCKMTVAHGHMYCGEHEPATVSSELESSDGRIPCPLDPKHTVYKRKLQKHLKICNAQQPTDLIDYIVKDVNAGEQQATEDFTQLKLGELADDEFYGVINLVKGLYAKHIEDHIGTLNAQHRSLDDELAKQDYSKETRKHLLQNAALLGILEQEAQLQDSTSYIEFGAGKGQLAFHLAQVLQAQQTDSQVILLDRMSLRHKKDNKIEDRSLVHRIRVDIGDFRMSRLPLLATTKRNVAVSKHLCGGATDLALRCITQATSDASHATATDFIMIALCCHHRCDWRSFVGKDFLQAQQVTPRQFSIMTKMVGWAICGTGMSRERRRALVEQSLAPGPAAADVAPIQSTQRLSLAERECIGFMCKRVLDHARLDFLRRNGYEASLKSYVPKDVTLENVCLLAKKCK